MSDAVTKTLEQVHRECMRALDYAMQADGVLGIAAYEVGKEIRTEFVADNDTQDLETVNKRIAAALSAGVRFRDAIYAVQATTDALH